MARRRLLPLTLGALAAFAVLIGLGTWQIERLHWKEALIAARTAAVSAAPADLPRTLEAARPLDFHRVRAAGVLLHDREILVHAIERQRGAAGYLVLTPMRLEEGAVVLVERGWVPGDKRETASRAAGNPPGDVAVEGLLRLAPSQKPGWFIPENDPVRGEWFWIDLAAMARAADVPEALPFYVEAGAEPNPGGLPVGGQANTELANDHLQYAITWYALAGALAVIYLLLLRRELAAARKSVEQP
jgi:surfeit locus 1 family protein